LSHALFAARRLLWLPLDYEWQPPSAEANHCCLEMHQALAFDCDQHADPFECPDTLIVFHEPFGEYGLPIRDGGPTYLLISHCPFCGTKLPESGRDAWFDALEAAGLDDVDFDKLPARYRTGDWRQG
jgi:hypothetical protein